MSLVETFSEMNFELSREIPSPDRRKEVVTELINTVFSSCISYLKLRYNEIDILQPILGMFVAYQNGQLGDFEKKLMESDTVKMESTIFAQDDKICELKISFEEDGKAKIHLLIKPEKLKGENPWEYPITSPMQA